MEAYRTGATVAVPLNASSFGDPRKAQIAAQVMPIQHYPADPISLGASPYRRAFPRVKIMKLLEICGRELRSPLLFSSFRSEEI